VLATGLLLGYYGWRSIAAPPLPSYRLDFGKAQWIRTIGGGPQSYFRKRFFVSEEVEQAWVQVAATGSFRLFVNDFEVHNPGGSGGSLWTASSMSANASTVWDIKKFLKVGINVISVEVLRSTYPGPANAVMRGFVRQATSQFEIISDNTWKASDAPGIIPSLIPWTDPLLDQDQWLNAQVLVGETTHDRLIQPVSYPPAVLESPLIGQWIGDSAFGGTQTIFSKRFDLPQPWKQVCLEIAAVGDYTVTLNGHWLGDFEREAPALELIYLKRFVKPTGNQIEVQLRANNRQPFLLAQITALGQGDQILGIPIGTNNTWAVLGQNGSELRNAQPVGRFNYEADRWGVPPRNGKIADLSYAEQTWQGLRSWGLLVITLLGVVWLWRIAGSLQARARKYPVQDALTFDALLHLPVFLVTAVLLLLPFDVRLRPETPLRRELFFLLLALLMGLRLLAWLLPSAKRRTERPKEAGIEPPKRNFWQRRRFAIALGAIVIFAFGLRFHGINTFPLDQDDIFMVTCAKGIFQRGYPSVDYGGVGRRLTTYEAIPYPLALSSVIFGWSDFGMRVPALIFGTLTTLLIGRVGKMWFGPRVGLFAALVYACLPWTTFWSLHCFHPQQVQFFSLLSIASFYVAIRRPNRIDPKHFRRACIFFIISYFSWEGSGFLLPAFAVGLLLMHPGRWGWLRQPQLWIGLSIVGSVIVIQFSSRYMAFPPYLTLGYTLADLGTPVPFFLDPQCQPFYYINTILISDPFLLLTICFCFGLLLVGRSAPLRFCVVVYLTLLISYSILLPAYAQRYGYYYQSLLILGACGAVFEISRRLLAIFSEWRWWVGHWITRSTVFAGILLIFVSTTNQGLELWRLSQARGDVIGLRYGLRWQDSASSGEYVVSHLQPGDLIIANLTQAMERYGGRLPDMATDTLLGSMIVFDRNRPVPHYEHRITNIPMILTVAQVRSVMQTARRIWYVTTYEPNSRAPLEDNVSQLLTRNSRIVYTCYSSAVYLWEGFLPVPEKEIPDLAEPPHPPLPAEFQSLARTGVDPINPPSAQLPFRQPLRPNSAYDTSSGLVEALRTPSPDQGLIPLPGSLRPPLKPSPTVPKKQ
jgi:4-amino-4-deoxy-L-arabinose transferase-like glycosyltransferase